MNGSKHSKSTVKITPSSSSSSPSNFVYQKLKFEPKTLSLKPQIDPQQSRCLFTFIPVETFINICQYLTPWDLFSISFVCRKFRGYLTCTNSSTTTNIWRTSRKNTIFFPQLPPPEGLSEREYCKIVMLEKGCQFCSEKSHNVRIYWIFRVRSCWDCLIKRIQYIPQDQSVPHFASGLPFETFRMDGMFGPEYKVFWKHDYELAETEFSKIKESQHAKWIQEKCAKREYLMADALKRGKFYQDSKEIHKKEKLNKVKSFCYLMMSDFQLESSESRTCNNNNQKSNYNPYILSLCPTLNETISLPDHLFVQITFKSWQDKMLKDYEKIEMKYSVPMRYNQIHQRLLQTRLFFHPLYHWILHCETYLSPPYINNDPRKPWSEEFLDRNVISRILYEAVECERKAKDANVALQKVENLIYQRVVNLKTAIEFGLGRERDDSDKCVLEVFQCKICRENTSNYLLYSYRGVKKHLQQRHFSIEEKDLDNHIELDYKTMWNCFKHYSNNWFKTGNYPYNLPKDIMSILEVHRMPWWKSSD